MMSDLIPEHKTLHGGWRGQVPGKTFQAEYPTEPNHNEWVRYRDKGRAKGSPVTGSDTELHSNGSGDGKKLEVY